MRQKHHKPSLKEKDGLKENISNIIDKIEIIPAIQRNPINWFLEKTKNWIFKNGQRIWAGQKQKKKCKGLQVYIKKNAQPN